MTGSAECARTTDTLVDVARKMRDLDVGALPICGDDDRLKGMITDRDIVVRAVADGTDPSSLKADAFAEGKPVTVGADGSVIVRSASSTESSVAPDCRRRGHAPSRAQTRCPGQSANGALDPSRGNGARDDRPAVA